MSEVRPTYCGHCGALLSPGATFCGKCGQHVVPATSTAVPPPPPPPSGAVIAAPPSAKLGHRHTIMLAAGIMAVVVVVVTVVAVKLGVTGKPCTLYCGPHVGPRLADQKSFTDSKWNFVVEYGGSALTLNTNDANSDSVDLLSTSDKGDQLGEITVTGMSATSTQNAIQAELDQYKGNHFDDIQPVGPIPGAEIGLVPGDGEGYTAALVSADGRSGTNVGIQIIAVTHGNETLVASMWSPRVQSSRVAFAPFYLFAEQDFDHVITDLRFTNG